MRLKGYKILLKVLRAYTLELEEDTRTSKVRSIYLDLNRRLYYVVD
jgi:hypothetical protein